MIPIVLGILALALLSLRRGSYQPQVGGRIGSIRVEQTPAADRFRSILLKRLRCGQPITRWLSAQATAEAYRHHDARFLAMLAGRLGTPAASAPSSAPSEASPEEAADEGTGAESLAELGASALKSPLDGVEDDDWAEFVSRIRTKDPGFKSDKYVGQYEQNRARLAKIGVAEPTTTDEEHAAIGADMSAHSDESADLISRWSGDVVSINGTDHPVCHSGILGLLKSAGAAGAESWLANPADRVKYPKTTEAFLRANGCF